MAFLYVVQRRILYIPPDLYVTPQAAGLESALEIYEQGDSQKEPALLGWWIAPERDDAAIIMFFHGNGSAVYSGREMYRTLADQGYGIFALAYPGYPGREGPTTQDSLVDAALQARAYLIRQGTSGHSLVYYGTSLGAGLAAQLAMHHEPALLILEAPFTSAQDRAQNMFPYFPARLLVKDKFRSDIALSDVDMPLLWLHGTRDRVIPLSEGRALYNGYAGTKTHFIAEGAGHNDVWLQGGQAVILNALSAYSRK